MNQEEIGKKILKIRKDNNLTQKDLANKLGVTYQAVSKWETGKNIPDIAIIKQLCNEYNIDINEMLDTPKNKVKNKKIIYIIPIIILLSITIGLIIYFINIKEEPEDFNFKTITTSCKAFNITGSIAYNSKKSSIYISNIEYCGEEDKTEYENIECYLYEVEDNKNIIISTCDYKVKDKITLNEYLKNIRFNIDNYPALCKEYKDNHFILEIKAYIDKNKTTTYEIPLEFKNNCKK